MMSSSCQWGPKCCSCWNERCHNRKTDRAEQTKRIGGMSDPISLGSAELLQCPVGYGFDFRFVSVFRAADEKIRVVRRNFDRKNPDQRARPEPRLAQRGRHQ